MKNTRYLYGMPKTASQIHQEELIKLAEYFALRKEGAFLKTAGDPRIAENLRMMRQRRMQQQKQRQQQTIANNMNGTSSARTGVPAPRPMPQQQQQQINNFQPNPKFMNPSPAVEPLPQFNGLSLSTSPTTATQTPAAATTQTTQQTPASPAPSAGTQQLIDTMNSSRGGMGLGNLPGMTSSFQYKPNTTGGMVGPTNTAAQALAAAKANASAEPAASQRPAGASVTSGNPRAQGVAGQAAPAYPAANSTPEQREAWKQQMMQQVQQAQDESAGANYTDALLSGRSFTDPMGTDILGAKALGVQLRGMGGRLAQGLTDGSIANKLNTAYSEDQVAGQAAPAYPAANSTPEQREAWKQQMMQQAQAAQNSGDRWGTIGNVTGAAADAISGTANGIGKALSYTGNAIKDTGRDLGNRVVNGLSQTGQDFANAGKSLWNWGKGLFKSNPPPANTAPASVPPPGFGGGR